MIDVIVPVRGAGPAFRRCVASLIRHVAPSVGRIVVVLDGRGDADAHEAIDELGLAGMDHLVLENPAPLGFPASVNRGMAASDRDVVLLNSDTQVTARWLEKLAEAAASAPDVATVTPFSNNATIASLPVFLAENTIPDGFDVQTFAALVEAQSTRGYPSLPTGVGVCLYIRRAALDALDPFDEAFGLGYGEEVDFCLRASAAGFRHVLDDATFIFHEGHRSFGASRAARIRQAERRVRSRFPHYDSLIHGFIQADPLAPLRARVVSALRPPRPALPSPRRPPRRIVHVVHGWPPWAHGGTEHYAAWLAHAQATQDGVAVYTRVTDPDRGLGDAVEHLERNGVRVRLVVNNFTQRDPICRNGLHCGVLTRDFGRFLDDVRPDLVHVHHLAGHCASLLGVARQRRLPIVYQAQDWWPACGRVNLVNRDGSLCPGPTPMRCARCLPQTSMPPATLASAALHVARARWIRRQLAHADAVIMGSRFIADSYARWRILPEQTAVHVVPYGVPALGRPPRATGPLGRAARFGVIGALLPHKGVHTCLEAFAALPARLDAELHVWGSSDDAAYRAVLEERAADLPRVHLRGAFEDADRAEVLRSLDVLIVPSIGWESFGLSAREAWQHGLPVIASRRSALLELFPGGDEHGGTFFEPGDPADLARVVTRALVEPGLVDRWRQRIPAIVTVDEHASAIDAIYDDVIRQRR